MTAETLAVVLAAFVTIALLPRIFFKPGRYHFRWFLTAAPFLVMAVLQVVHAIGGIHPWHPLPVAAIVVALGAQALIWLTVGSHRIPISLWHQDNDGPVELVTWGPYRHIRHPFYAAFLMACAAGVLATPHWTTVVVFALGALAMAITARREERRLSSSQVGTEYRRYMGRTGRFIPRVGRKAA